MSTKRALLTSQIARAIPIGSDTAARDRGLEKIRNLFAKNSYPEKIVRENVRKEQRKYERGRERGREEHRRSEEHRRQQRKEKRKENAYIRLPFISDRVAAQVKSVVGNSGLAVCRSSLDQQQYRKKEAQ